MSKLLKEKLEHFFCESEDKAQNELHSVWIRKTIDEMKIELLRGSPELSPQTIRWFERWLGEIGYNAKQTHSFGS